ncbi:HDOD domain-containing protein, partial [Arthrospira platensis SPKY1]|nr:HDOD domain-containing protein [Arthrospira platensis SPKY1]
MRKDLEQRLRYSHNLLPTLPGVALKIIDLANDSNTELADLAKIITMDSALVIRILKVANSPLYSVRRKSNNLRQAISLLGLNATLSLALGFSLSIPLQGVKRFTLDNSRYWRRSLISAIASRTLGKQQGLANQEE